MKFIDIIRLSLVNLKGNKLRTILTILGVGIGIAAIFFLVTLGFGLQRLTINQIIKSSALTTLDVTAGKSTVLKLNNEQIDKIKKLQGVEIVSPVISLSSQMLFRNTATDCVINGIDNNYWSLGGVAAYPDKFQFTDSNDTPQIVVSSGVLKLFAINDPKSAIGEVINLDIIISAEEGTNNESSRVNKKFVVAGFVNDESSLAYIYYPTLESIGVKNANSLKVKVNSSSTVNPVKESIEDFGFNVSTIVDMIAQIQKVFQVIQFVLAGFGIIALLVASIGMFNTMTIALLERTRDIGIMKAIGARRRDVRTMFITEAIIIGMAGGFVGVIGGWLLGVIINLAVNALAEKAGGEAANLFYTPWQFVVGVIIFSFIVGLVTGIYPARRAMKINPLEALRYE